MKLGRDYENMDTQSLFRYLYGFKRSLLGLPLLAGSLPSLFLLFFFDPALWLPAVGIFLVMLLFLARLHASAHTTLVSELEKRMRQNDEHPVAGDCSPGSRSRSA